MSDELVIAVTPYHLATREVPAMGALLLADRVVTLMPGPESGSDRGSFDEAVKRSPRFVRMMERLRWSVPMWKAGVVSGAWGDEVVSDGLRGVCERAADEEGTGAMRRLFEATSRTGEFEFLDRICTDVIKGGPDPSVSIPIAACIDEFAARHGVMVARAAAASVAQRAESMLHRRRGAFVMPILTQASGRRILEMRQRLERELADVRRMLVCGWCAGGVGRAGGSGSEVMSGARGGDELAEAVRALSAAFERAKRDLVRGDDDSGARVMDGYVSVSIVEVPTDAVFRSSEMAMRTGGGGGRSVDVRSPGANTGARLQAMVIKSVNLRPSV